jgi:hypothetical protein
MSNKSKKFYEHVKPFDVDGTLILNFVDKEGSIRFRDPETNTEEVAYPHWPNINLLKKYKEEGCTIIVWSGSGGHYSHNVLVALGIRDLVDLVMDKPLEYVDDQDCGYSRNNAPHQGWMGRRIWLKD